MGLGRGRRSPQTFRQLLRQQDQQDQALPEERGENEVASRLEPLLDVFDEACVQIRNRRNKYVGHNDSAILTSSRSTSLFNASRDEIESALSAPRNAMNCIGQHYTGTSTLYQEFLMNQDGEHLVGALAQARRYRELLATGSANYLSVAGRSTSIKRSPNDNST